jgi:DNA recombination protein RmuC
MENIAILVGVVILLVLFLLFVLVVILFFQLRKLRNNKSEPSEIVPQIAVLGEKISHIEPVTQAVNSMQSEIRGLTERIISVEKNQYIANQGIGNFATNALSSISELKTLTTNLSETTGAMRNELSNTKNNLTELHAHIKSRQEVERQTADSIRRLETIIAGTQTKGSAGENVLEVVFAKLPIEWQVRDFRIGGKSVEFALRLPNNLIMPIDRKCRFTKTRRIFADRPRKYYDFTR